MIHPLWSREWRGGERRWWNRPGLVLPLIIAVPLAVAAILSDPGGVLLLAQGTEETVLCVGARTLWGLPLWMIWAIVASFARDRVSGDHHQIATTRISARQILLIKTLVPAAPALCAGLVAGILTVLWLSVDSALEQITLMPVFLGLGDEFETSVLADLLEPRGAMLTLVTVQMVLGILIALTVASWLALRRGGLVTTLILGWGIWLLLVMLPIALFLVWEWISSNTDFLRTHNLQDLEELERVAAVVGRWQFLLQALSSLVLPLLWLAYWFRWARRDFEEEYLGGR